MSPTPFEQPSAPPVNESIDSKESWLENSVIMELARRDVGEIISELQREDESVFICLPLPDSIMTGLTRMYLKGIEDGRLLEDLREEVVSTVRRACIAKKAA